MRVCRGEVNNTAGGYSLTFPPHVWTSIFFIIFILKPKYMTFLKYMFCVYVHACACVCVCVCVCVCGSRVPLWERRLMNANYREYIYQLISCRD